MESVNQGDHTEPHKAPEETKEEKLAALEQERSILLKWISAGEGVSDDRALIDKLNTQIAELKDLH
jgi:hypothetical protein